MKNLQSSERRDSREITNLITINTSYSKEKATEILKRGGYDTLFMDFTRNQEAFIRAIAKGVEPELAMEHMKDLGLVKEPEDTQDFRAAEPLFECLPSLELEDTNIYCYKEEASRILFRDIAVKVLILTAKAKLGKIEVEEWKEVMRDDIYNEFESAEGEAKYIADRAEKKNICLDASEELLSSLSGLGFRVKEIVVDKPCKPLDILGEKIKCEILGGDVVTEDEVIGLVRDHVRFVEMIIEKGYERAYWMWSMHHSKRGTT
ncbi:MAG: hypothetical protein N2V72_04920 [Methanophagales archaeon]|nr:hypothetical protein [Methanophagales archaeon]